MKVLLIGGTGLISAPMTLQLVERGHEVTVYNRAKRSPHLPEGVKQIVGDRHHAEFEAQMADAGPFDAVIDMICYAPGDAESLIRAFAGKVEQMIVCSTVDVYEKPQRKFPLTEETPFGPSGWDYAQNKAALETILWEANRRGDFPLTVFRPGHTYHDDGALHHSLGSKTTYLDRLRKGKPIITHGDGTSFWSVCHAVDVARAFTEATGNPVAYGKAYNVAGLEPLTWNLYHAKVAEAIGAPEPTLVHIPTDLLTRLTDRAWIVGINFGYNNLIDNSPAISDLDYHETVPFVEGARRIYRTLNDAGRIENSDDDPLDDRIIAAWNKLSEAMIQEVRIAE